MAFPDDLLSNTPAKLLFKLVTETNTVICDVEPLEFASGSTVFKRDLDVGGVFISYQADSLTFVGNGAELLRNEFNAYELNAKCTLIIYWFKNSTRTYIEYPSRFDIAFNFYEVVKVGNFHFGIRVKAVNSSTQTKLDNRQDIEVDVTKLVSIGGVTISGYGANDVDLKKELNYPAMDVNYQAEMFKDLRCLIFMINYFSLTYSNKWFDDLSYLNL